MGLGGRARRRTGSETGGGTTRPLAVAKLGELGGTGGAVSGCEFTAPFAAGEQAWLATEFGGGGGPTTGGGAGGPDGAAATGGTPDDDLRNGSESTDDIRKPLLPARTVLTKLANAP
jgi:hypothetical protein